MYGITHSHSENSLKDSAMSVTTLVKRVAELGGKGVVLTDHGILSGIPELMSAAGEAEIKGIPGVELYIKNGDEPRAHLICIAADYEGYKALMRMVSKSYGQMVNGFPVLSENDIKAFMDQDGPAYGHVIATSACVQGVISSILGRNVRLEKAIAKAKEKLKKYTGPNDPVYLGNLALLNDLDTKLEAARAMRDENKLLADKKFTARQNAVRAAYARSEKEGLEKEQALKEDMLASEEAKAAVNKAKREIVRIQAQRKKISAQLNEHKKGHDGYNRIEKEINQMQSLLCEDTLLFQEALDTAIRYHQYFGRFYIELQYHGLEEEQRIMPQLVQVAKQAGLPVIAANDAHYALNTPECVRTRWLVQSLRYNKAMPRRADDDRYYIMDDDELRAALLNIAPEETVESAITNISTVIDACNVVFPKTMHFPKFPCPDGQTAEQRLRDLAYEGINRRFPNRRRWNENGYRERMEYELEVIEQLDYSDYLLIVQDFLEAGRKMGKMNPEEVGMGVGPGRGSSAGSLVCYLIGITEVDPLRYGLLFERFLNKDRVSYPDIDSDFAIDVRAQVVDYVKSKYGDDAVCGILTKGTLAAKAAIRAAARVLADEKTANPKAYMDYADALCAVVPNTPDATLDAAKEALNKAAINAEMQNILSDARLLEGVTIQHGMHAAGVIIADNRDVGEYAPLIWNEAKGQWLTQYTMTESEKAGLLKMDFLGLKNLNIITDALRNIYKMHGLRIDMTELFTGMKDGRTTNLDQRGNTIDQIFAKGKTNGVFQFESRGMKGMLRKFKPRKFEDLVLLVAAYRPGPMQYLDDIIDVRHNRKKPHYIVPALEPILRNSYGYTVYQETVMQICNKVAGFTLGEADIIRRAMSKKKLKELVKYQDKFIQGFMQAGASRADAESFWQELLEFSKYAFNKSHAVVYAAISFMTGWLKLNYPTEYMTALLKHSETEKYGELIGECTEMGIAVLPPSINHSEADFSCGGQGIYFGLGNIKGVKGAAEAVIAAREEAPFVSLTDFMKRAHTNKAATQALIMAGAMDDFSSNRTAMLIAAESLADNIKRLNAATSAREELENLCLISKGKEKAALERKLEKARQKESGYNDLVDGCVIPETETPETREQRSAEEKELLGLRISWNPLDDYGDLKRYAETTIADIEGNNADVCGVIEELRRVNRKSDGKPMAFFKLTDRSGCAMVSCFTREYEQFGPIIKEGAVVALKGRVDNNMLAEEEDSIRIIPTDMRLLVKKLPLLIISMRSAYDFWDRMPVWENFIGTDYELAVHDRMTGEIRKLNPEQYFTVSKEILCLDYDDVKFVINDGEWVS